MKTINITALITIMLASGSSALANDSIRSSDSSQKSVTDASLRAQVAKPEKNSGNKTANVADKKEGTTSPVLTLLKIHGI